jgi:hypothetical protein
MRRRRTRNADGTKGPTYYILGCDVEIDIEPTPESGGGEAGQPSPENGVGTISKLEAKPSPNQRPNHLQWSGDKPVKEPVKEPYPPSPPRGDGRFGISDEVKKKLGVLK